MPPPCSNYFVTAACQAEGCVKYLVPSVAQVIVDLHGVGTESTVWNQVAELLGRLVVVGRVVRVIGMRFGDRHVVFSSGGNRLGGRLTVFDGALWLRTQHLHLVHHDLGGVAAQSVLAVPFVTAQPAFGIDQLATGQELLADRRQPVECDQRVILNVLLPVSVIVLRIAVGRQPELGDRQSLGTDDDFWVASQAADEDDAVDHVLLPSKSDGCSSVDCFYQPPPPDLRSGSGSTGTPAMRTSKWRCGPVLLPVDPMRAIGCPAATTSPGCTSGQSRWP